MTITEIYQIVTEKTGKVIATCTPISLSAPELALITGGGETYCGKIQGSTEQTLYFRLGDAVALPVNQEEIEASFFQFDNVIFDKVEGTLNDDSQVHFSGYRFTLINP